MSNELPDRISPEELTNICTQVTQLFLSSLDNIGELAPNADDLAAVAVAAAASLIGAATQLTITNHPTVSPGAALSCIFTGIQARLVDPRTEEAMARSSMNIQAGHA